MRWKTGCLRRTVNPFPLGNQVRSLTHPPEFFMPRYLNEAESDILTRILKCLNAEASMTTDQSRLCHFETEKKERPEIIRRLNAEFGMNFENVYDMDFGNLFKFIENGLPT